MLSPAPDCPAAIPLVPLARASLSMYPQFVATIEEVSSKPTGFRADGTLEVICRSDAERELSTLVALHHGLGLPCGPLSLDDVLEMEPALGREVRAGALLPDETSVNTRLLTAALLTAAQTRGVELLPGVEVIALTNVETGKR